ncbi:MAG TPA: GTP-binding protein [Ktedonobacterales bacterium]
MADANKERSSRAKQSSGRTRHPNLTDRARDLFTVSTLLSLPSTVAMVRKFLASVNWKVAAEEVEGELQHKVVILGLANSGKSTLFNTLRGEYSSAVSPEAGTTKTLVRGGFGPFQLIDTPGHLRHMQEAGLEEAAVAVYLLDADKGLRREDVEMIKRIRGTEKPLAVALNKVDLLKRANPDEEAARLAAQLGVQDVIPICARSGENVADELIPALIEISPEAAVILGRQLPKYRREAANKLVRTAALISLAAGLEPIPLVDIPILLGNQIRMVLRIAAIYGEPLTANYARELVATMAGGLLLRYVAEEAAKAVPFGGDLVSGAIAAAGTWSLGQVAIEYFEGGRKLSRKQINDVFKRYYSQYREQHLERQLAAENGAPAGLLSEVNVVDADRGDGRSRT